MVEKEDDVEEYLVTTEGLQNAVARRDEFFTRLNTTLQLIAEVSGQSDDATLERIELFRQEELLEKRYAFWREVVKNAILAPEPTDNRRLVINTVGTFQLYDENDRPMGTPREYHVVGYEETDLQVSPPRISYTSHLLDHLYDCEVDESREPSPVTGKPFTIKLLAIRVYRKQPVLSVIQDAQVAA